MNRKIYQVIITIKEINPKIWRRLLVPSDMRLSDFHKVIQTSFGWTNSHLHQFIKNDTCYTRRMQDDDYWDELENVDYHNMKIFSLLYSKREKMIYEYDFGDSWRHEIILEEILPPNEGFKYPLCLDGARSCPPEDCGGVWGYQNMMKILKKPKHEEYESYIIWLDGKFNSEYFNKDKVNKRLKLKNYGCFEEE